MPSICRRVDDDVLTRGESSITTKPGALESMETLAQQLRSESSVLEKHRPTPLVVPGARADRTEAQVLKNLCGVWSERYVKSDLTARDKYLESSGWSYLGRTLISQKPESDLHVEHDAARSELSLYTIPDNIVLHQIIKFTGAPMGITGSLVSEYDFVDWTTALCTGRIDIDPQRNCVTLTKWTNRQAKPAKYGNSTRDKVEASAAALKYDYHGVWEHVVSEDGQWLTVKQYNSFTHRTKPDKSHTAHWTLKLARVCP